MRLGGAQPDYKPMGQAGNGKPGIADKSLADADMVRTVCRQDADTAGPNFNLIGAAVFVFYDKGVWFL